MGTKTFVIAEAGSTHDGDLDKALMIVDDAARAGADAVKFQFFDGKRLAARRNLPDAEAMYVKHEMPEAWLPTLKWRAEQNRIEFMCTAYDSEGLKAVLPFVSRLKVASYESLWDEFLLENLRTGKEVIVSVPEMASPDQETYVGFSVVHKKYLVSPDRLLHVVQEYPCPVERLHLAAMEGMSGLSDHSTSLISGAVAVALGAKIIEKHFKDGDTDEDNPDYPHSLYLDDMETYIRNIREAEKML